MSRSQKRRWISAKKLSIAGEVDYIVRRAQLHDSRVVTLGQLVLFSTETGDAWMLDPQDGLALCLARDGGPQPINIKETPESYAIEWNSDYQIEGERFIVVERTGRIRTIVGYPTREILKAQRQATSGRN